jgi:methylated-DNA-[protein]-cysteine S-methyltransferase
MAFASLIETPVGPVYAEADDNAVTCVQFDHAGGAQFSNALLDQLRRELHEYFTGQRSDFSVPLAPAGTDFQKRVWTELQKIPPGQTICYEELAHRIGKPTAQRAVAQANGANPICILIPCHRVIAKNGRLGGYSAGLERKRFLLGLEQRDAIDTNNLRLQVEKCSY